MEIIDAHAHIYPEKIAEKATDAIGAFYDIEMQMPAGTADRLVEEGKNAGISRFVVHSVATSTHQVRSINKFIKEETDKHPEFIGFMTLHQDLTEEEIFSEVKLCKSEGFYGIKLHPDFQKFNIDDENVLKIYRAVKEAAKDMPILFHTGDNRYDFSKPYRLRNVAKMFPELKFIGAHFGGYRCWDEVEVYKGLDNVYFDTSSSLPFITVKKAGEIMDILGKDRFFFGTDYPMWDASGELERFMRLKLTEREKENILSVNLKTLLGL